VSSCAACGEPWPSLHQEVCPRCGRGAPAPFEREPDPAGSAAGPFGAWEPLPPEPTGGFHPEGPAAAPPLAPRRATLVLALALVAVYVGLGGSLAGGLTADALQRAGGLHGAVLDQLPAEAWRLVRATFVHADLFVLIVTLFLVGSAGGEAERRGGSGLVLACVAALAPVLNAVRVALEPGVTLTALAGGWPAGVALGGAATALALRRREGPQVTAIVVLEVAILLFLAFTQGAAAEVGAVLAAAGVAGLALGAVWPLSAGREGAGCCAALAAALLLGGAEVARERAAAPPPPWVEAAAPAAFELRRFAAVGVALETPGHWEERGLEGDAGARRTRVQLVEGGGFLRTGFQRQVLVVLAPKGPFDAADTLATRVAADLARPGSFLSGARIVEEGPFPSDSLGLGYSVTVTGRAQDLPVYVQAALFVQGDRTIMVRLVGPADDHGVVAPSELELTGRIARSVRLVSADEEGR